MTLCHESRLTCYHASRIPLDFGKKTMFIFTALVMACIMHIGICFFARDGRLQVVWLYSEEEAKSVASLDFDYAY